MKASLVRRASPSSLALVISCSCLAACGGSKSPDPNSGKDVTCPPGQTFDGEYCQVDQSVATKEQPTEPGEPEPTQPAEPTEETPAEPETPTDPEPTPTEVPATQRAAASPVDITMAAQAGPIIQYLASSHLPSGAKQMGAPFAGQFAEGQELVQKVQLTVGKCYTVVAAGLPPVAEVNLELFVEGEKEPLVVDETKGVQAVIGSRSDCIKPATTGPHKLVIWVEKGQGVAAAQVFQK